MFLKQFNENEDCDKPMLSKYAVTNLSHSVKKKPLYDDNEVVKEMHAMLNNNILTGT